MSRYTGDRPDALRRNKHAPQHINLCDMPQDVGVWPEIAAAGIIAGLERPMRLWDILRAADRDGRGFFNIQEYVEEIALNPNSPFRSYSSPRNFRYILEEGNGIFWTLRNHDGKRYTGLQMHGVAAVKDYLGIHKLFRQQVFIHRDMFRDSRKTRAAFYVTWLEGTKDKPISRATITEKTSVSPTSQTQYEKIAEVVVTRNYVIDDVADRRNLSSAHFIDRAGAVVKQISNSYQADNAITRRSSRARTRDVNKRRPVEKSTTKRGNERTYIPRVYYANEDSARAAANATSYYNEYRLYQTVKTYGTGSRVWKAARSAPPKGGC